MSKPQPSSQRRAKIDHSKFTKVSFRVPQENLQECELLAVHFHVTLSDVLRWAVSDFLDPENPVKV
jgi:hypothetical protein